MQRYRGDNGQYVHQDGGTGGRGGGNLIVNIGNRPIGNRPIVNRPLTTKATTTAAPPPPPPPSQPSPPVYFIDQRGSGVGVSQAQEPSGAAAAEIHILRQDQEETENGYRYV